ncbi:MAG TPA: beta-ketoacyl-[acyl-carrier-protein] synthase family protein [Polyangiaceae bacterium]
MPADAIAVTAVGAITALGTGVDALWAGLLEGRRPFGPVRGFDVEGCRVQLAAEVRGELPDADGDRSAGLAVVAAVEALQRASVDVTSGRVGLIVGSAGAGTKVLEAALCDPLRQPRDWWRRYQKCGLAQTVAAALGVTGPTMAINTACSSGSVAIGLGRDWLRAGDCDQVLAIGTDELGRFTFTGFHALRAMDPEPCRPFDRQRRGLTMGEGAGCLILERAVDAQRRQQGILGYVLGVGMTCDAHHLTAPDPRGHGAARALKEALEQADVGPESVGFVNAHGTGTPLNDAAEVASLELVLEGRAPSCPVHSIKASTGHCMGAAGALEAIVTLKSLETGIVPATAGLLDCEFDARVRCVKGRPMHVEARYAVSTNFGFGGNDAAVVFSHAR